MSRFLGQLLDRPTEKSSRLSRYTEGCGYAYFVLGLFVFIWPAAPVKLALIKPFSGQEEGLVRLLGFVFAVVGYLYFFGGRTHQNAFGLATVVDRLLVPFAFGFIYMVSDIELMLLLPVAIIDPLLGIGAYLCWRRDETERPIVDTVPGDEPAPPPQNSTPQMPVASMDELRAAYGKISRMVELMEEDGEDNFIRGVRSARSLLEKALEAPAEADVLGSNAASTYGSMWGGMGSLTDYYIADGNPDTLASRREEYQAITSALHAFFKSYP